MAAEEETSTNPFAGLERVINKANLSNIINVLSEEEEEYRAGLFAGRNGGKEEGVTLDVVAGDKWHFVEIVVSRQNPIYPRFNNVGDRSTLEGLAKGILEGTYRVGHQLAPRIKGILTGGALLALERAFAIDYKIYGNGTGQQNIDEQEFINKAGFARRALALTCIIGISDNKEFWEYMETGFKTLLGSERHTDKHLASILSDWVSNLFLMLEMVDDYHRDLAIPKEISTHRLRGYGLTLDADAFLSQIDSRLIALGHRLGPSSDEEAFRKGLEMVGIIKNWPIGAYAAKASYTNERGQVETTRLDIGETVDLAYALLNKYATGVTIPPLDRGKLVGAIRRSIAVLYEANEQYVTKYGELWTEGIFAGIYLLGGLKALPNEVQKGLKDIIEDRPYLAPFAQAQIKKYSTAK